MQTPEQRAHNYMLAMEAENDWQDQIDRRKEDICHRDDAVAKAIDRFVQAGIDDLVIDQILTILAEQELLLEQQEQWDDNLTKIVQRKGMLR